ncbi:MAG: hypothetical protein C5B49_00095 [Bdellovibrio sp.]|nr:MAG: hypothetical protein C5B49_00095 [Bdellovibrio sp.]
MGVLVIKNGQQWTATTHPAAGERGRLKNYNKSNFLAHDGRVAKDAHLRFTFQICQNCHFSAAILRSSARLYSLC